MKRAIPALIVLSLFCVFQAAGQTLTDGASFAATQNPIIYRAGIRPSSDAAAINVKINGENVILMVTSSDLQMDMPVDLTITPPGGTKKTISNYYPMDKTYLYAMSDTQGPIVWYDFDAIAQESDFPWAGNNDWVWAPDIEVVYGSRGVSTYYLFVPLYDTSVNPPIMRIGVKHRVGDPFGPFDKYDGYVTVSPNPNTGKMPRHGQFMYDPGVCNVNGTYYLTWCDGFKDSNFSNDGDGKLQIGIIPNPSDMTKVQYLGQIVPGGMPGPVGDPSNPAAMYIEGPDIVYVPNNYHSSSDKMYLIFAAKYDEGHQEYIGYASASPDAFKADPVNCWAFEGWIQKDIDPSVPDRNGPSSEWTNHATFVVQPDKINPGKYRYFYFYHYSQGDQLDLTAGDEKARNVQLGSMRQIAMKEVFVNKDGRIVGVNASTGASLGHVESTPADTYGSYAKPYVIAGNGEKGGSYSAISSFTVTADKKKAVIRYYINNTSGSAINGTGGGIKSRYFLTTENGGKPVVENVVNGISSVTQVSGNLWYVEITNTGTLSIGPYEVYPPADVPISYTLKYSNGADIDITNDFSAPRGTGFTSTDRIAVYDGKVKFVLGDTPNPDLPTHNLTSSWRGRGMAVTLTNDGTEVRGQEYHPDWSTQKMIFEPVYENNTVTDRIRIRISNTEPAKYLAAVNDSSNGVVRAETLNTGNDKQKWTVESVLPFKSVAREVRIRNVGNGRFLTLGDDSPVNYSTISAQKLNKSWESQIWLIDQPRVYIKSVLAGRLLTVTGTANDSVVKAQTDHSGWESDHWLSQEWLLQPITGTPYFRIRNEHSGLYLNLRSDAPGADVVCHEYQRYWGSQQWQIENGPSGPGAPFIRFKNRWTGKYLTVMSGSDYADVKVMDIQGPVDNSKFNLKY